MAWRLARTSTLTVMLEPDAVTVTEPVPEAELYLEELAESGVNEAVSVSVPVGSAPAGMAMVAEPELSGVEADV